MLLVSLFVFFPQKCRLLSCGGSWYRPLNSHATMLDKYWTKIHLDNLDKKELNEVSSFADQECFSFLFFVMKNSRSSS